MGAIIAACNFRRYRTREPGIFGTGLYMPRLTSMGNFARAVGDSCQFVGIVVLDV